MADGSNRYYEMRRLSAVFACASIALLISLLWWIWVDLTPPWKTHQRRATETRAALWRLDELASGQALTQPAPTSEPLAIRQVVLPLVRRDLHFTQTATTDRCMTCHAAIDADDLSTHRLATKLTDDLLQISERIRRQNLTPQSKPWNPRLGEWAPVIAGSPRAQDNGRLWPSLEPSHRYTFMCSLVSQANEHLGRNGSPPIKWQNPAAAHPSLDLYVSDRSTHSMKQMGCTVCHEGGGDETDFVLAGHATYPPHESRSSMERPMLPAPYTEASCAKCHPQISDTTMPAGPAVARRLNQGRVLVERWGCVNCHLIEGFEDTPKVGPSLAQAGAKLEGQYLWQWILSPREFRPWTTMPQSFQQENSIALGASGLDPNPELQAWTEVTAMTRYLVDVGRGSQPAMPREIIEALRKPKIATAAAERGERLFNEVGCLACHPPIEPNSGPYNSEGLVATRPVGGQQDPPRGEDIDVLFESPEQRGPVAMRFAPDLSNVNVKFRGGDERLAWLRSWLIDPRQYSPDTRMPRFRLDARSVSPATDPAAVLDEATDLASYLSSLPVRRPIDTATGDQASLQAMRDRLVGQLLAVEETRDDVIDAQILKSAAGNDTVSQYLTAASASDRRWLFLGQQMLAHYGCAGCHQIPGLEDAPRIGPELTRWADKPSGQLDLGFFDPMLRRTDTDKRFQRLYPTTGEQPWLPWIPDNLTVQIERTHASFVWHKLRNPRMWDRGRDKPPLSRLRMPNFFMNNTQAGSLATFVLSRRAANVDASLIVSDQSPAGVAARGRNLARSLNCTACHTIDGNGVAIHAYYWRQAGNQVHFQSAEAPPRLPSQGARVTAQWTYEYMRDVTTIRPWLSVRMPSFNLSDEQTILLAEYFSAVSSEQSRWLGEKLVAIKKGASSGQNLLGRDALLGRDSHLGPLSATSGPNSIPSAADVLFRTSGRDTTEWEDAVTAIDRLRRFALSHGTIPAQWLDPIEADRPTFSKACDQALADAAFLRQVYSLDHPFLNSPAETATANQIADGQTLFQELQCLQCHVFGNPVVPGANAHPTAPDLQQASRRLRQTWVAMWLRNPRRIQPGTRMPGFFGDGDASAFADYPPEDRAVVQLRLRNKSLVDNGPAQIQAIVAFVYDASSRQVDVVREAETQPADN